MNYIPFIGMICLGVVVGLILGFGLAGTRPDIKQGLAVLGGFLGGAPLAFLKWASVPDTTNAIWCYPIGLLVGALLSITRLIDPTSIIQRNSGYLKGLSAQTYPVFYKKRYRSEPQLIVRAGRRESANASYSVNFHVIEQRPDGFKVKVESCGAAAYLYWEAVGIKEV
jgi:hypothetical protein